MARARTTYDAEALTRAAVAYQSVLDSDADSVPALVGLGWVLNSRHDFDGARPYLERALALEPENHHAHALLGDAAMERGNYEGALEHFQAAIDTRPDLSTLSRSAQLLWLTGDDGGATRLMGRAIAAGSKRPTDVAWCRAERSVMLARRGSLLAAEREAHHAVAADPGCSRAWEAMAGVKSRHGDLDGAVECYQRALENPPHDGGVEARIALVELHTANGDGRAADRQLHLLEHLCGSGHSHGHSHDHGHSHGEGAGSEGSSTSHDWRLARLLANLGRTPRTALAIAERAYAEAPNVWAADTLAWCLYRNGRLAEAEGRIQEALRWGTPSAEIQFHAGMIAAAAGDRPRAQQHLYQALNLDPSFHPTLARLASRELAALARVATGAEPPEDPDSATAIAASRTTD